MIAEWGVFSLILALCYALLLVVVPTIGIIRDNPSFRRTAPALAIGQFVFVSLSFGLLTACFLRNDFTVIYVLSNSSLSLPWFYKLCAVWGGHEGSMLLWVLILSFWTVAVACFSRPLEEAFRTRVLVVLGSLTIGFILFLLTTSNPFLRQFTVLHAQGRDLNPLLQDPGFLFHPPMLYMGYVGFSVAFAFAIAALWMGRVESRWAKWTRPWTLLAWCCLTAGITLGSWWAYRELGWGGWWFWDPVENASFMPWLAGTALIHSLMVSEKRQQFLGWTLLLAIMAFSLSLIGTFLVRSGVLTSVHAFAVDPQRGLYILGFLLVVIGGSLLLFACRAHSIQRGNHPALVSRESALLLNNVFLVVTLFTVLMGTVYPLLIDGLGLGKLSVGAPYFNTVFVPLMIPVFVLMGFGIHLRWQQDSLQAVLKTLRPAMAMSVLVPLLLLVIWWKKSDLGMMFLGIGMAVWVLMSVLIATFFRIKRKGFFGMSQGFMGMAVAHVGVAASILGVAVSTGLGVSDDVKMSPGSQVTLAGYRIQFIAEEPLHGANYHGTQATFVVSNGKHSRTIYPEKRIYNVGQMAMTDSAIDVNPLRDIYVALGEPLGKSAWSVRLYYKPLIRFIWGGGFLMLAGGLIALTNRRYYRYTNS